MTTRPPKRQVTRTRYHLPIAISNLCVSRTINDYFARRPVLQQSKSIQSNGGLEHAVKKRTSQNRAGCIDSVGRASSSGGKSCGDKKKVDRVVHDSITVMASTSPSSEEGEVSAINTRMIEDSQQEIDVRNPTPPNFQRPSDCFCQILPTDSDDEVPSLESLLPTRRSRRSISKPTSKPTSKPMSRKSSASKKPPSPVVDEFSLAQLLQDSADITRRQAERERINALLSADTSEDEEDDGEGPVNAATERVLGKESNDKLKSALNRIGMDFTEEGGFKFFTHGRGEREFDPKWIEDVEWLKGFEGLTFWERDLIVVEEMRNELLECGYVRDMMALGEELPSEVVIWLLEHGTLDNSVFAC